jgi:hypothetical protein
MAPELMATGFFSPAPWIPHRSCTGIGGSGDPPYTCRLTAAGGQRGSARAQVLGRLVEHQQDIALLTGARFL